MIKAIVFDLDGVYFESGTEVFVQEISEKFQLAHDEIARIYFKSPEMRQYKTGQITGNAFWKFAIDEWRITTTKDEIMKLLVDSYAENPETLDLIQKVRTQGIKTAVCTNNFPERLMGLEERFHFKRNFDVVVASYEEGIAKPDPQIFEILAKKLALPPSDILMSDDNKTIVETLKHLGFMGILYTGLSDFKQTLHEQGVTT